jgi:predicted nucleic acid-binding protein
VGFDFTPSEQERLMPRVTFDTNIFISRPDVGLPDNFYMSVVVLQELVVGAEDETEVKDLNTARREYEKGAASGAR